MAGRFETLEKLFRLKETFHSATAITAGQTLIVSTGAVERAWRWTGKGLVTIGMRNLHTGKEWADLEPAVSCDWHHPDLMDGEQEAELLTLTARSGDDEGFTSGHLEVSAEIHYPEANVTVNYRIWAYPSAPGIRTQLWMKGNPGLIPSEEDSPQIELLAKGKTEDEWKFKLTGLKAARKYALTFEGAPGPGMDDIALAMSSLDGESEVRVLPIRDAEAANDDWHPNVCFYDVPEAIRLDGTANIRIPATVAEGQPLLRLYERLESGSPAWKQAAAFMGESALKSVGPAGAARERRVDHIPVNSEKVSRILGIGYYNDTQNRNRPDTPVLREEELQTGMTDWASILALENEGEGLAVVKESHKCVNQPGVDTGVFICDGTGLHNTGRAVSAAELETCNYRWCWASWVILYACGEAGREQAIKQFDRIRYPARAERDLWTVVCTWGHCLNGRDGRNYATEKEVLHEMDVLADLGMDMLLIDDGWQVSLSAGSWKPEGDNGWKPHPEVYPQGWKRVIDKKRQTGLRLGLWGVAHYTSLEELKWNWEQLHMEQVKLDFANLRNQTDLDQLIRRVRTFMADTGHSCIISWDTTENAPRYGYYWAREYGNVHFMNRKPERPESVVYVPWLALRDFWHLARYQNLNKWQLVIQNPEVVNREASDAYLHSVSYCIAAALMGIPEFMSVPRYYSDEARDEIRSLLKVYKEHRRILFDSIVYPIGEEPSNGSWTGFQAVPKEGDSGYLIVLRERLSTEKTKRLRLHGVRNGMKVKLLDLRASKECVVEAGENGSVVLSLEVPADFLFLRYEIV